MRFPDLQACMGSSRDLIAKTPAIPQALEFNSQRKLDLPLAILDFLVGPPIAWLFRERADIAYRTVSLSTVENLRVEMLTAKVWMVHDVEEFGAELQIATLSQES